MDQGYTNREMDSVLATAEAYALGRHRISKDYIAHHWRAGCLQEALDDHFPKPDWILFTVYGNLDIIRHFDETWVVRDHLMFMAEAAIRHSRRHILEWILHVDRGLRPPSSDYELIMDRVLFVSAMLSRWEIVEYWLPLYLEMDPHYNCADVMAAAVFAGNLERQRWLVDVMGAMPPSAWDCVTSAAAHDCVAVLDKCRHRYPKYFTTSRVTYLLEIAVTHNARMTYLYLSRTYPGLVNTPARRLLDMESAMAEGSTAVIAVLQELAAGEC